jgi:hypothetical protein
VPEDYAFKTKTRKEISVGALSGSSCMIVDYFFRTENRMVQIDGSPNLEAQ